MEVASLLGPMLDAVSEIAESRPVEVVLIQAPTIDRQQIDALLRVARTTRERVPDIEIVAERRSEALAAADLALSSSGTATLEAAVLNVPVIVMYRLSPATHWLARRLVKLPHFSLVNIVAGREVVPELLQEAVNGKAIAAAARRLLEPAMYLRTREELTRVRGLLGQPGASLRAAQKIATLVRASQTGADQ